jgi:hypothetical protein
LPAYVVFLTEGDPDLLEKALSGIRHVAAVGISTAASNRSNGRLADRARGGSGSRARGSGRSQSFTPSHKD